MELVVGDFESSDVKQTSLGFSPFERELTKDFYDLVKGKLILRPKLYCQVPCSATAVGGSCSCLGSL